MISMTEGCNVSPLNSRSKSGCASSSVTSTPALASNSDRTAPPGPPPTTQQVVRLTSRIFSDAVWACSSTGLSVCMRPPNVRVEVLPRKGQPLSLVLFVGQFVFLHCREEQLASGLGEEHPYKGACAGPDVVRTEPAELDLPRHIA